MDDIYITCYIMGYANEWELALVEDVVKSLGLLCLGSRFRRIGERLQADTQHIIDELGIAVQAAQYPFLAAIDRNGPLTIGELALAVGITQPGATRAVSQLLKLGYLDMQISAEDQRRRVVSLTPMGRELIDYSRRALWPRVEQAVFEVCGELSGPMLEQLAAMEAHLSEAPLSRRGNPDRRQEP